MTAIVLRALYFYDHAEQEWCSCEADGLRGGRNVLIVGPFDATDVREDDRSPSSIDTNVPGASTTITTVSGENYAVVEDIDEIRKLLLEQIAVIPCSGAAFRPYGPPAGGREEVG